MPYRPRFHYTHQMVRNLGDIEGARAAIDLLPLPLHLADEMRRRARVRSTHYSTKIEGNPLRLEEVEEVVAQRPGRTGSRAEQEVRNYWEALSLLTRSARIRIPVSQKLIRRLHAIIDVRGPGRRKALSEYRKPVDADVGFGVRDSLTGAIVYVPPDHEEVPRLMKEFVDWLRGKEAAALPVPIRAAIGVYQFLTIHPFWDGNGRSGRALATYTLYTGGYDLRGFYSLEEYYAYDLQGYYENLQMGLPVDYYQGRNNPDLTPWIEYFVRGMAQVFGQVREEAVQLHRQAQEPEHPRLKGLDRRDRQALALVLEQGVIFPAGVSIHFQVSTRTARGWLKNWVERGLLAPAGRGTERFRSYKLGDDFKDLSLEDLGFRPDNH